MKIYFKNGKVKDAVQAVEVSLIKEIQEGNVGIVVLHGEIINISEIAFTD